MDTSAAMLVAGLVGAVVGLIAGIVFAGGKAKTQQLLREQAEKSAGEQLAALQRETERWRADAESRAAQANHLNEQLATQTTLAAERLISLGALDQQSESLRQDLLTAAKVERQQAAHISELVTTLQKERESAQEKLKLLTEARVELSNQFEALAGKILDEKIAEVHRAKQGQSRAASQSTACPDHRLSRQGRRGTKRFE